MAVTDNLSKTQFRREFLCAFLVVAAVSLAVVLPFVSLGIPSGHDFEFHMNSWMEVHHQWEEGVLYPRWAELAHGGYGEARFIFYPPASWMLGAALGSVLPWKLVPAAYSWIVLTLSGMSMFVLARQWLERRDAVFAAVLYAANPYYLVIVYWRSAYAELLAGTLLPLLVLFVLRLEEERWRGTIRLGLVVAAAWLTNAPSAVMVNYSVALLVVVLAIQKRSPRILWYGAAAVVVGLGLAAFYVLPAAYEEKWVAISQVLSPGVRPQDNYLFRVIADPDHNRFNRLVSLVAVAEMVDLFVAVIWSRMWPRKRTALWTPLVAWAAVISALMFSLTSPAWNHLPELRFIQLPWRWLLCLNVSLVLLLAVAWRQWWVRGLAYVLLLAGVVFVWHRIQAPWWDHASDVTAMEKAVDSGKGYDGTDEYVPSGADAYDVDPAMRRVVLAGRGHAQFRIQKWEAEEKEFTADLTEPSEIAIRLFNYPAWNVEVNGRAVEAHARQETGEMIVPVGAGKNDVSIKFGRTLERAIGGWISGAMLLAVAGGVVAVQRTKP